MKILHYDDLVDVPWKNGGGITRNIALATFGRQTAWRLSRADVAADGPFSSFAGLERVLTVVSDAGMTLEHEGGVLHADSWSPVRFGGELDVMARLKKGPLTDLNLMFDPLLCDGTVTISKGPSERSLAPPEVGVTMLHVLAGEPVLNGETLGVGDTTFVDDVLPIRLADGDAFLEIVVRYLDQSKEIRLAIAER